MKRRRILYIDAIKAFAIYMVVIGHILPYGSVYKIIYSFHMPLFMFASGLVTNPDKLNLSKRLRILIPFFLIGGLIYTYSIGHTLLDFIKDPEKSGYWYLYVLSLYIVILWTFRYIRIHFWFKSVIVFVIFVLLVTVSSEEVRLALCLGSITKLWPFFIMGILMRPSISKICNNKDLHVMIFSIILYIAFSIISNYYEGSKYNVSIIAMIRGFFVVMFFFLFFRKLEGKLGRHGIHELIALIGGGTMEIYTLHYFFLRIMSIDTYGLYLMEHNPIWFEFILAPALAALVIFLSLIFAMLIYRLGLGWVFGKDSAIFVKDKAKK